MSVVRLQSEIERQQGIYYEYDPSETPLGVGGMGKVQRGWCCNIHNDQRREVAIKFLYSARREAAVQLRNDNLIEMLGFLEIPGSDVTGQPVVRYHVVSEFLHGVTLDDVLNGKVTDYKGNIIPFAQELYGKFQNDPYHFALIVIRSLLSGLMALHDAGYIHRDIDPSNIMVTSGGHIKLIDFGITKKIQGNNTKESSYTVAGQFIGKPKYAAPELVRGLVDSQGVCTDLYAVGILLYQLVVGAVPFEGEMAEVLDMQLNKKLPLHNIKQKALRNVINTATQKRISARYQSAAEFRVALDRLMSLPYPDKGVNFKVIGGVAAAAVVVGVVFSLIPQGNREQSSSDADDVVTESPYDSAVRLLKNESTAMDGFKQLQQLANEDDAKAVFLLSRLYFRSGEEADNQGQEDTLQDVRTRIGIGINNEYAHELLVKAVSLDRGNYQAEYELGCDYKSNRRGTTRQNDSAYIHLSTALTNAKAMHDAEFVDKINDKLSNVSQP
jgi:serine/threonine-protein kinase